MFDIASAADSVKLAMLESQLLEGGIDRATFVSGARSLGLSRASSEEAADKYLAISRNQAALRSNLRPTYDFVVVGSGAAGSVVARRLADNPDVTVLLLEAGGGDLKPGILITESWFFNQGGELDWNFSAEPSPGVNNRSIVQAGGRALGGGTSINGMVWAKGHRADFDRWASAAGDDKWGYRHVRDIYRRIEDWHGAAAPECRGGTGGGEVFVQPAPDPHPMAFAFLEAAAALGLGTLADQSGILEAPGGAAITNVRIRDGRRLNIPASYLYPAMDRPNLTVLTKAHVNRLSLRGARVVGVEFDWQGSAQAIGAGREVIVSAGALQTPKILMLSGIGDKAQLDRFAIPTIAHLPGVGQNLQDHPIVGAGLWESPEPIRARNNAAEANLFASSRPDLEAPDLHLWHIEAPYVSEATGRFATENAWSICPGLVRPQSRGCVRLRSADPRDALAIHANMLDAPRDLEALRKGMEIARAIGNSAQMKPFASRELLPGPAAGEALDNLIRDGAMSMHHPVGTARMGQDDLSVVDAQLRVRGVQNLRVADGSIMPVITTGNTQAPCAIIGERMAEILAAA